MVHGVLFKMEMLLVWKDVMFVKVLVSEKLNKNKLFEIILFLAPRPTLPTDIGAIDDVTIVAINNNFFGHFRDEIQRYAAYLRQRFMEIVNHMKEKMKQFRARISDHFTFYG